MDKKLLIYVVHDDESLGKRIAYHLNLNPEWEAISYYGVEEFLYKTNIELDSLILCYDFDDISPKECLNLLRNNYNNVRAVHVLSQGIEVDYREYLLNDHILDVLNVDDVLLERIWNNITVVDKGVRYRTEVSKLNKGNPEIQPIDDFISNSAKMQKVRLLMNKASNSDINVSIFGETGTGKEVVAKTIHKESLRWDRKFVAVNVTAIPSELIESAFFGHEKGAFTGAVSKKIGFFEEANGGTLFLDEIGDMDLRMQAKLLRVLQEGEITRVGGIGSLKVDVRIISATNKDLAKEVERGNFREDLYYRLLGLTIILPPLRERGDDIIIMSERFIADFCKKNKKPLKYLHLSTKNFLKSYAFPGNVRELRAIIELAVVITDDKVIMPDDLSIKKEIKKDDFLAEERSLRDYEILIIKHFLEKYENKVRLVAKKLGIGKTKIYDMIQKGEIDNVEE